MQAVDRHAVRAIALDANAFGRKARLSLGQMEALGKDASEADVEVWLPEVVAWELASNVADQHEAARESIRGTDGTLHRAGLEGISLPYADRGSVVSAALDVIKAQSVRIIETTSQEAYEALRDQVQLAGPGRRKEGVKTGAADSAWVRSVVREAATSPDEEIVVVSADRDVDGMIAHLAPANVALAIQWNEVRRHLFEYAESAEAAQALVRWLVAAIDDGSLPEVLDLTPLTDGGISSEIETGLWHYFEPFHMDIELERVSRLAALQDVEANARGGVRATAILLADVFVKGWFNDNDGNPVSEDEFLVGAPVEAQLAVRLKADGIEFATLEEVATVRPIMARWWDETEALGECMHQLHFVPALEKTGVDFSLIGQYGEDSEVEVDIGAEKLRVSVSTDPGSWEAEADIGEQRMVVRCEYDATTWVGGEKEGMHMEPPYELSIAGEGSWYGSPLYALCAFAMEASARLQESGS